MHARLPDIHRRLKLMTLFNADTNSERCYYLTCFEGAIYHIMGATPDKH